MNALEKLYLDAEEMEKKLTMENDENLIKKFEKELNFIYQKIEEIEAMAFS
jgi:hypothetical protein